MKKLFISMGATAMAVGSILSAPSIAAADDHHHHHHNNGAAIAGGIAAGVLGGVLAGSAVNNGRYYEPPPQRCWTESRPVQNQYDGDWHYERVRVCD